MTPSQVKMALRRNRRAGRRPWSQYQLAAMRGCDRSLVARVLQNPRKSRPLWEWIESLLGPTSAA
jgi:hypothetical protein